MLSGLTQAEVTQASWWGMEGYVVLGAPYLHFTLILRGIKQSYSADGTLVFLGNLLGRFLGLAGCGPLRQAISLPVVLLLHI